MKRAHKFLYWSAAGAGLAAGLGLAAKRLLSKPLADLHGQVVLITGASRGLGLQLAREFARCGTKLAICARDADELRRAETDLYGRGAEVFSQVCDVTQPEQIDSLRDAVIEKYGAVDILVNNAGIIQVGPLSAQTLEDFDQAMNTMFWGPLYAVWAVLPGMLRRGSGRIVNITSIGGKIAVPHLLPYCAAKFALVGLSEGLHAELRGHGIHVLTVVPSLMRTGSHYNAFFKGHQPEEYKWFSLGATIPVVAMNPHRAARKIVRAIRKGSAECVLSAAAKLAVRINAAAPETAAGLSAFASKFLLPSDGGSDRLLSGKEAARELHSRAHAFATSLGKKAAMELNQLTAP